MPILVPVPQCLDCCGLTVSLNHSVTPVTLSFYKTVPAVLGLLHFQMNVKINLLISTNRVARILIGVALNPQINLKRITP